MLQEVMEDVEQLGVERGERDGGVVGGEKDGGVEGGERDGGVEGGERDGGVVGGEDSSEDSAVESVRWTGSDAPSFRG